MCHSFSFKYIRINISRYDPAVTLGGRAWRRTNMKTFVFKDTTDKTTLCGACRGRYVCVRGQNNLQRRSERLHSSHRWQVPASVCPHQPPKSTTAKTTTTSDRGCFPLPSYPSLNASLPLLLPPFSSLLLHAPSYKLSLPAYRYMVGV